EMIMAGEEGRLARLETENPFSWFDREPTDYVGECSGRIQGWCYDAPHQELVYRPGYAPHLAVAGGDDCIRLRVRYRNHADGVTKFPPVVTLTLVASIDWFGMQRPAGAW
ncbi:MAG: hypothetical protein KGN39_12195, partial [Betaproteobacteria bacterium]|nr:hypothetical protein [Betaproteobacteria bacterium]